MKKSRLFPIAAASFLMLFLALVTGQAQAQSISSYLFAKIPGTYTTLTGDSALDDGSGFDDQQYQVSIGFPFQYGTRAFGNVAVSANGFLKLGSAVITNGGGGAYPTGQYRGTILKNTNGDNFIISALCADLAGRAGDAQISIARSGAAPNRRFSVQYYDVRRYTFGSNFETADTINFQITLVEDGSIEMSYGRFALSPQFPQGTQVGLRGSGPNQIVTAKGTTFLSAVQGSLNTDTIGFNPNAAPPDGLLYIFSPPVPANIDGSAVSVSVAATPLGGCQLSTQEPVTVRVRNSGIDSMHSATVCVKVNNGTPKCKTVAFTPPLATREEANVAFTGTDGADLSQYIAYTITGYIAQQGDTIHRNDSAQTSLSLRPPVDVPGPTPVTSLANAKTKGWLQAEGTTVPGDSTDGLWEDDTFDYPGSISLYVFDAEPNRWLYRPGVRAVGVTGLKFRLLVADAFSTAAAASIQDDSLKVVVSSDCGVSWHTVASFTQADKAAGRISNQYHEFIIPIISSAGIYSVGFVHDDNGTGISDSYQFHLDDITFISDINASADSILNPVLPANRLLGNCPQRILPISAVVTNRGVSALDTVVLGYKYNNGAVHTETFLTHLVAGQKDTLSFSAANLVAPSATGIVHLRIFTINNRDLQTSNDTAHITFIILPAQAMPGSTLTGLNAMVLAGYTQVKTRAELQSTTNLFAEGTSFGPTDHTAVYTATPTNVTDGAVWLVSPMYFYNVGASLNFSVAATNGTTGTGTVSSIGNDSLKVLYRLQCGPWQPLALFRQADLGTLVTNRLQGYFFQAPNPATDSIQFAFEVARGVPAAASNYRWHIGRVRVVDEPLGTRPALRLPELSLYPVPAHNSLEVLFGKQLNQVVLHITDLTGRVLMTTKASGAGATVDVGALTQGMYLLTLETGEGKVTRTFTVE